MASAEASRRLAEQAEKLSQVAEQVAEQNKKTHGAQAMSDNEANRRAREQMQKEIAEAHEPHNRYQKRLDDWWQSQRDFDEEEADVYYVGGFQERWSETPSFTKGRRDKDWRAR